MWQTEILMEKEILIVDDEVDILEALEEYFEDSNIHTATSYLEASKLLQTQNFDLAILDIMGVRGYELLEITVQKKIPTLMLTANALSFDNLMKAIEIGADAYVPKDQLSDIAVYAADSLKAGRDKEKPNQWFKNLTPYFEKKFGAGLLDKIKSLWPK